jgi:hypothetical protein
MQLLMAKVSLIDNLNNMNMPEEKIDLAVSKSTLLRIHVSYSKIKCVVVRLEVFVVMAMKNDGFCKNRRFGGP